MCVDPVDLLCSAEEEVVGPAAGVQVEQHLEQTTILAPQHLNVSQIFH